MGDRLGSPQGAVSFWFGGKRMAKFGIGEHGSALQIEGKAVLETLVSVTFRGLEMKCFQTEYALQTMWMTRLNQAGSLQGHCAVRCGALAANNLGTGTGWQQSKQDWVLPAVVR